MKDGGKRTLWSPWSLLLSGSFVLVSLVGFSSVFADPSDDMGTGWQVFCLSMGVVGLAAGIRNPFRRVILEGGHVLRVGWFKRKQLFICSATTGDAGSGLLAAILGTSQPVVTTVAGKRVKFDELFGFGAGNSRIARSVDLLQEIAQPRSQDYIATVQHQRASRGQGADAAPPPRLPRHSSRSGNDMQRAGWHRKRTTGR